MSYFDELVAKYKNLQYGQLSSRNPSAVDNILQTQQGLLGNSLQFGNQKFIENIPTSEQEFINTPTGRVAQNRFRMGPDGNPIFGVPGQLNEDGSVGGAAFYDSSIDYGDPGYAGVLPVDPVTGLVTDQTVVRQGGGRDARNQSMTTENYNFAGGSFVGDTLNEDGTIKYGIHDFLPGGLLARGLTSPAKQLQTLQSLSAQNMAYSGTPGNVTGAASDIAKLARDVQDRAERSGDVETAESAAKLASGYSGLSRDTAQANMDAAKAEAEKNEDKFNLGDFIGGLLTGGDDKKDTTDTTDSKGDGGGYKDTSFTDADDRREQYGKPDGDSNDSDGKIICTMMNESYGFGSYRNAIWLKYSKDHLLPEHQIGYHKIFLPLVAHAKGKGLSNYIVKVVIEHLTRHRTIDCKQEMRGKKRHALGRIYRAIFEPLCYIVGKYGK